MPSATTPAARRSSTIRAVIASVTVLAVIVGLTAAAFGAVFVQRSTPTEPPDDNPINRDGRPLQPVPEVTPDGMTERPAEIDELGWDGQDVAWQPCEGGECAEVLAPLDWDDPAGPTAITLFMRKVPATQSPRLGTIFVNPGGPGGSGADFATGFDRTGLEQYDIVGWDPRGVGASTPVVCSDTDMEILFNQDSSPDDEAEREDLMQAEVNLGASCLENSGQLLENISTVDTVQDLDMLRSLVGDRRLNYYGASYGTEVGARYASMFPQTSGRLVLDSAVDITGEEEVAQSEGFQRALENFSQWCAEQEQCVLGGSAEEVMGVVTDLTVKLDSEPVSVGNRSLTQSAFVTAVAQMLYSDESVWSYLGQGVDDARNGDGQLMLAIADSYWNRNDDGSYGGLLKSFNAIRCLDEPDEGYAGADADAAAAAEVSPWAGRFMGPDYGCPSWPVAAIEDPGPIEAEGAEPILVVGTTGDSATPYENAVSMADQLGVGRLLTFEGNGHVAYGRNECVNTTIRDYFLDRVPEDETTCSA
ncbi:alpha/beta hydrolase [Naumannella halotolerans]|uniref:alpha/beta hydrolase n=1 Tax=Naumannella halotolerans TaxID=993414 RepID=UPI00105FB8EA|nr:alpha/beta hydrolase [Naumannella halotolerans]